jgi:hypothetical protein
MGVYTVGQLLDFGYSLTAYCGNVRCGHNARIDLEAFPDEMPTDRLTRRCGKCGEKGSAIVSPTFLCEGSNLVKPGRKT